MGVWPGKDDFFGATMALIRLTNTYKLPMELLAKGIIYGTETVPLTAHEFSLIGDTARERDLMYESVLWYNQSAALLKMESTVDKTKTARAMKKLASSWFNYGMPSKALEVAEEALQYDTENRGLIRDLEFYRNSVKRMSENDRKKVFRRPPHPSFPYYQKYEGLCRGQIKSPREMAKLYCNYQSTSIPIYWTKVEYSNIDPPVVLFHDVISQSEIDWMIETATEQLSRSILGDVKNAGSMYSEARISENAWLADNYEMSIKLGKRISLITGLDASVRHWDTYAEPFQVLNYGLGGMYEPHHDFTKLYRDSGLEDNLLFKNSGDRVATWMFYLTDVKAGGATVFPTLKARVPAIKGAAAFWYNIKRSGVLDDRSLHAGCPLLLGTKWAANKWFRELGQAFRYGCTLDPSE
ncbi:prolyl 4-hydroxylase subunit alpha-3-like [Liolophura sinensis]|uniref:prolyl 4-hydroxylase subunit alpha-3-like n=1 Tax=Liolophura sinensis TaxID=3198878 RepID=UPI003158056D